MIYFLSKKWEREKRRKKSLFDPAQQRGEQALQRRNQKTMSRQKMTSGPCDFLLVFWKGASRAKR
jgi:hypothetical protein